MSPKPKPADLIPFPTAGAPLPSLYDLTADLRRLVFLVEEHAAQNDGDVAAFPFLDELEKLEGDTKAKVLKCAMLYKEWKQQGESIAAARKKLNDAMAKREESHANRGENLRKYMESCLPPNAKWEDAFSEVAWYKKPGEVEVLVGAELLPELYLKPPAPREVSKSKLGEAMIEYEIPLVDNQGQPVMGPDEKPVMTKELQVRYPIPTGEMQTVPHPVTGDPTEVPVLEERVIARKRQGRRLNIR